MKWKKNLSYDFMLFLVFYMDLVWDIYGEMEFDINVKFFMELLMKVGNWYYIKNVWVIVYV